MTSQTRGQAADLRTAFDSARRTVLRELDALLASVDEALVERFAEEIHRAARVYVLGAGRSGLSVEGFAMRLMHLGYQAHCADEVTAPAVGSDDLVVTCSGSGSTPTVVQLTESARQAGARIIAVTSHPESEAARLADLVVPLREYSADHEEDRSAQFVGTLFEQGAYLFFDCVVLSLQHTDQVDEGAMFDRHTNLE
ncbi:6-phospho-3-hexuloisomerase [Streptomyces cyaneofuscatus]|uniref:6-phospho-3-hexuloisomerase n=1 Tax=Streptomyces cyaneofuscatus TaxID=66883 RepID=UPI0029546056|nr:6-phospho-3-hexuloisomerase [Streptomyces cyaneofuscatus]WOP09867.1 6-phospho-3-hexuloisomerase [Streptomyces cyaneofuscatus]